MQQFLTDAKQKAAGLVAENATTLLTAGGVVGTIGTGVLAWRGGYKTGQKVLESEVENLAPLPGYEQGETERAAASLTAVEKIKLGAIDALPPVITGAGTIAAIIFSHRMSAQKAAAMAALYGLSQNQFEEYRAKVAEKLTGPKKQAIEDEISQDRVNRTPGHDSIIVVEGEVLCFDEPTGRYFRSTMDKIKTAVNTTNAEILHHDHANASFFYEELEMPATTWTDEVGWNTDHMMDLKFSTVLTPDGKPCIAIDFNVLPKADYIPNSY